MQWWHNKAGEWIVMALPAVVGLLGLLVVMSLVVVSTLLRGCA